MIKIPRPGSLESLQGPAKKLKTALELEIENLRSLTSKSGQSADVVEEESKKRNGMFKQIEVKEPDYDPLSNSTRN